MNIAYNGVFLEEGFAELGHRVIRLDKKDPRPLREQLGEKIRDLDLLVLEPFGGAYPLGVSDLDTETVFYSVDAPINEFWTRDFIPLCDHAFADQKASVKSLANYGINALWLPLCAKSAYFSEPVKKEIDVCFVGTVNDFRVKRRNWLSHVSKYFNVFYSGNLSVEGARDVFARSRVALNENLFPGLTLRIFQTAAAGAVAFTGTDSDGVEEAFVEDREYAVYRPDDLIEKLNVFTKRPALCDAIGENARRKALEKHLPVHRATTLLETVAKGGAANARQKGADAQIRDLSARFYHVTRFGGSLAPAAAGFSRLWNEAGVAGAEAALKLGDICAIGGRLSESARWYEKSAAAGYGEAKIKLALLALSENKLDEAEKFLTQAAPEGQSPFRERPEAAASKKARLLYELATARFLAGARFDLGYYKSFAHPAPDTAFEIASLGWKSFPSPAFMEIMLACIAPFGAGILLPELTRGIKLGALSPRQIIRAADLARDYYEFALADEINLALRKVSA